MTRERNIELEYESLQLRDDFMFSKVMMDETNCIGMLERLTGNHIDSITTVVNQKSLQITNDSKAVRYDIYVEDNRNRVYDAEMQNKNSDCSAGVLSKRARAYQSMIDLNQLEAGCDYRSLKRSYVIFICTFDPFGYGYSCYAFENICNEPKDFKLFDERIILFFNTKGEHINVSKETQAFLDYIEKQQVSDDYTGRLESSVIKARMNKEWRVEYMKTYFHDLDVKNEGIAIGMERGMERGEQTFLIKQIQKKLARNMDVESMAVELEESPETVQRICDVIAACGAEASVDDVYDKLMELEA